ncbi:MAG: hypothetical protein KGL39_13620 [Patescibacteria group bacterium]|nr:hypothetical protein [Patescibacteria group bacterium]
MAKGGQKVVVVTRENLDSISADVEKQFPGFLEVARVTFQSKLDEAEKSIRVEMESQLDAIRKANDEALTKAIEKQKAELTPPGVDAVRAMLEAEYLEIEFEVRLGRDRRVKLMMSELPARVERQFMRLIKDKLGPYARTLGELTMHLAEGQVEDKITEFFTALEPAADFINEAVSLILNAYEMQVTPKDVENGIALARQLSILKAQMECNRVRDFFSLASRIVAP